MNPFKATVTKMPRDTKVLCTVMADCEGQAAFKIAIPLTDKLPNHYQFYTCKEHIVRVLNAGSYAVNE